MMFEPMHVHVSGACMLAGCAAVAVRAMPGNNSGGAGTGPEAGPLRQLLHTGMSDASARHLAQMRAVGFVVIEAAIPVDRVAAIRDSVFSCVQKQSELRVAAGGVGSTAARTRDKGILHLPGMLNYDQSLAPYLAQPAVLDIVRAHLGAGARVTFTTCQTNLPGCERGEWHADYPYNQSNMQRIEAPYAPGPDHSFGITTLWM